MCAGFGGLLHFEKPQEKLQIPRGMTLASCMMLRGSFGKGRFVLAVAERTLDQCPRLAALVLISFFVLLTPSVVRAVPIVHSVSGGYVDIEVRLGGVVIGSSSGVALTGDSVTVDAAAMTLDGLRLEIAPTMISLSTPFGGYDEISVESAILEGDLSFATLSSIGVPSLFTAVAGPLTVTGSWGATDSSGTNPPTSGNAIIFPLVSVIGVVNVNPLVEINSVTINSIDGTPFGHPGEHLTIVGTYIVTTPEPHTGLLLAFGLIAMVARRNRR